MGFTRVNAGLARLDELAQRGRERPQLVVAFPDDGVRQDSYQRART